MLISDGKPLKLTDGTYRLVTDWVFVLSNRVYTVPKGFSTDLASIPYPFNLIWGKDFSKPFNKAAIFHDFVHLNGFSYVNKRIQKFNYWDTQVYFLKIMIELGEKPWNYLPIFLAVLLFSWVFHLKDNFN